MLYITHALLTYFSGLTQRDITISILFLMVILMILLPLFTIVTNSIYISFCNVLETYWALYYFKLMYYNFYSLSLYLVESSVDFRNTPIVSDMNDPSFAVLQLDFGTNLWLGIIFTTIGLSMLFFWAANPHGSFLFSLITFEIVFISIAVEMSYFSKITGHPGGFVFSLFLLTFAALESAIGLSYLVFFSKHLRNSSHFF